MTNYPPVNSGKVPFINPVVKKPRILPNDQPNNWIGIRGKPYVTVSAKGLNNGLSDIENDGADFGPDSLQSDGSLTKTSGIQEATVYADVNILPIKFSAGLYIINANVNIDVNYVVWEGVNRELVTFRLNGKYQFMNQSPRIATSPVYINISGITFDTSSIILSNFSIITNASGISSLVNGGELVFEYNKITGDYPSSILFEGTGPTNIGFSPLIIRGNIVYRSSTTTNGNDIFDIYGSNDITIMNNVIHEPGSGPSFVISGQVNPMKNVNLSFNQWYMSSSLSNGSVPLSIYPNANNSQVWQNIVVVGNSLYTDNAGTYTYQSGVTADGSNASYTTPNNATINTLIILGNVFPSVFQGNNSPYFNYGTAITNTSLYINANISNISTGVLSLSVNPPISGTVYQNTNPYDILIYLPVYTSTLGTAGNIKASIGPTSTSTTQVINDIANSGTTSSNPRTIILKVPAGWYYEFTGTTTTFGTAIAVAD